MFKLPGYLVALRARDDITCSLSPQRIMSKVKKAERELHPTASRHPFIFFPPAFTFSLSMDGALKHIPACIGVEVRRHFGQAASQSRSLQITLNYRGELE